LLKLSDKVVFREIDSMIVLINLETGYYYSLNEIGRFIFNRIYRGLNLEAILEGIIIDFQVSEDSAREDLDSFIRTLEEESILTCHS